MSTPNIKELRRQRARHHTSWPLWIRLILFLGAAYAIYAAVGFFAGPSLIQSRVERFAEAELHRSVTIDKVEFNPVTLSVRIDGLKVKDHDGQPLLSWNRLFVNLQVLALLADEVHFSEIELQACQVRLHVSKDGILNIADISGGETSAKGKKWTLRIDRLSVNGSELDYADESRGEAFHTHLGPTTFVLRQFKTAGSEGAPGVFTATTESGERIEWTGRVALAPLRSNGELRITQLALKKYAPFYDARVGFDVQGGTVDLQAPYEFLIQDNKPQVKVTEGAIQLRALEFSRHGGKDALVSLKSIDVGPVSFDWQASSIEINRIAFNGGKFAAIRSDHGIDLAELFVSPASPELPQKGNAASSPWTIRVGEIAGKGFNASLDDHTKSRKVVLSLSDLTFTARHLNSKDPSALIPVELHARVGDTATLGLTGTVGPEPLNAEVQLVADGIELPPLGPWIEGSANLRILHGTGNFQFNVHVSKTSAGLLSLNGAGDAEVTQFEATDAGGDPVLKFKKLNVRRLEYVPQPRHLVIAELALVEPAVKLVRASDQTLNVSTFMRQPEPGASVASAVSGDSPVFLAIDRVSLSDGKVQFTDQSIQPAVETWVDHLNGTLTGLTSVAIDRADVNINGLVTGGAPISISGKANLLSGELFADLKLEIKNSDLLPLSPYVAKFLGYRLTSGGMTLDSRAKLAKRKLDSSSNIVVTNFVLGDSAGPNAPKVPVHLALALLRDSQGKIALDLPVQGSLDDPNFHIGAVILQVIERLVAKAATSPFTLLGSIFGGGGHSAEDLSFAEFPLGSAQLPETQQAKLDVLAKALHERPALKVDVVPATDPAKELGLLREQILQQEIHEVAVDPARVIGGPVDPRMQIGEPLDPEAQAVAALYQKKFTQAAKPAEVPSPAAETTRSRFFLVRWFSRNKPPEVAAASKVKAKEKSKVAPGSPLPQLLPTVAEMRARLLKEVVLPEDAAALLAAERAKQVRLYLIANGPVDPDRISVGPDSSVPSTRVTFVLK